MAEEPAPLADQPSTESGAERRVWVRHPCNLDTMCQPGEGRLDQFWWLAQVQDISPRGMRLVLGRRFESGTTLAIAMQSTTYAYSLTLQAEVVYANPHPSGGFATGCVFSRELTDDELKALLS